ncbi:hypothetical protein SNEBB_002378 [Seison nebaliae]|nr:hypothetical protein SNEBB_002378 [Seison nebaliae]
MESSNILKSLDVKKKFSHRNCKPSPVETLEIDGNRILTKSIDDSATYLEKNVTKKPFFWTPSFVRKKTCLYPITNANHLSNYVTHLPTTTTSTVTTMERTKKEIPKLRLSNIRNWNGTWKVDSNELIVGQNKQKEERGSFLENHSSDELMVRRKCSRNKSESTNIPNQSPKKKISLISKNMRKISAVHFFRPSSNCSTNSTTCSPYFTNQDRRHFWWQKKNHSERKKKMKKFIHQSNIVNTEMSDYDDVEMKENKEEEVSSKKEKIEGNKYHQIYEKKSNSLINACKRCEEENGSEGKYSHSDSNTNIIIGKNAPQLIITKYISSYGLSNEEYSRDGATLSTQDDPNDIIENYHSVEFGSMSSDQSSRKRTDDNSNVDIGIDSVISSSEQSNEKKKMMMIKNQRSVDLDVEGKTSSTDEMGMNFRNLNNNEMRKLITTSNKDGMNQHNNNTLQTPSHSPISENRKKFLNRKCSMISEGKLNVMQKKTSDKIRKLSLYLQPTINTSQFFDSFRTSSLQLSSSITTINSSINALSSTPNLQDLQRQSQSKFPSSTTSSDVCSSMSQTLTNANDQSEKFGKIRKNGTFDRSYSKATGNIPLDQLHAYQMQITLLNRLHPHLSHLITGENARMMDKQRDTWNKFGNNIDDIINRRLLKPLRSRYKRTNESYQTDYSTDSPTPSHVNGRNSDDYHMNIPFILDEYNSDEIGKKTNRTLQIPMNSKSNHDDVPEDFQRHRSNSQIGNYICDLRRRSSDMRKTSDVVTNSELINATQCLFHKLNRHSQLTNSSTSTIVNNEETTILKKKKRKNSFFFTGMANNLQVPQLSLRRRRSTVTLYNENKMKV